MYECKDIHLLNRMKVLLVEICIKIIVFSRKDPQPLHDTPILHIHPMDYIKKKKKKKTSIPWKEEKREGRIWSFACACAAFKWQRRLQFKSLLLTIQRRNIPLGERNSTVILTHLTIHPCPTPSP